MPASTCRDMGDGSVYTEFRIKVEGDCPMPPRPNHDAEGAALATGIVVGGLFGLLIGVALTAILL